MSIKKSKRGRSRGGVKVSVEIVDIDRGFDYFSTEVKKLNGAFTAIGYFFSPGTPEESISARAIVNEFGAKIKVTEKMKGFFAWMWGIYLKKKFIIIPERPFMRQTFDQNKDKIKDRIQKEYDNVLEGKYTAKQALSRLGEWYTGAIKSQIKDGHFESNSEFTVAIKGSSSPLMDGGEMRNSTEHKEFFR